MSITGKGATFYLPARVLPGKNCTVDSIMGKGAIEHFNVAPLCQVETITQTSGDLTLLKAE
jgi:hypothetical protein